MKHLSIAILMMSLFLVPVIGEAKDDDRSIMISLAIGDSGDIGFSVRFRKDHAELHGMLTTEGAAIGLGAVSDWASTGTTEINGSLGMALTSEGFLPFMRFGIGTNYGGYEYEAGITGYEFSADMVIVELGARRCLDAKLSKCPGVPEEN